MLEISYEVTLSTLLLLLLLLGKRQIKLMILITGMISQFRHYIIQPPPSLLQWILSVLTPFPPAFTMYRQIDEGVPSAFSWAILFLVKIPLDGKLIGQYFLTILIPTLPSSFSPSVTNCSSILDPWWSPINLPGDCPRIKQK